MSLLASPKFRIKYHWLVTIAVTLGMFMSLMDSTIVLVAIPQMQHAFGATIHAVQWIVTIYMLTQAAVIPTAPYLTATFGGKRAYVWTLSAFLVGSLLCGFAWNLPSLIFFRFLQGIGGGILLPMVMTLLYQAFPPEKRGTATSVMGIPLMIAPTFGPVLGGYLVGSFGWQWAFFINVPLGVVAVIFAQKFLRQTEPEQRTHFDSAGFLTAAAGVAILLYAVSAITSGDVTVNTIILLLCSILLLLTFTVLELFKARHGREPLLDLRRFRDQTFAFGVLAQVFVMFVRFGLLFLLPIYLQTLHHETALQAGAIQGTQALATLAILPIAGRLADRLGPRVIAIAGLIVLIGTAALMRVLALDTAIWVIVGILLLLGCAYGMTQQIPVAAMARIQKEEGKEVANGSTLLTVLQSTAAPLGVAIISSLVSVRSQQYLLSLSKHQLGGELLQLQSSLSAMHEAFLLASSLTIVALLAMCFVPRRRKSLATQ
jgi:EmrB/QacA subfamily drug resistance transporter